MQQPMQQLIQQPMQPPTQQHVQPPMQQPMQQQVQQPIQQPAHQPSQQPVQQKSEPPAAQLVPSLNSSIRSGPIPHPAPDLVDDEVREPVQQSAESTTRPYRQFPQTGVTKESTLAEDGLGAAQNQMENLTVSDIDSAQSATTAPPHGQLHVHEAAAPATPPP
mmetsp:Transcript_43649/g.170830  ORF Transcript_43649/g.170830 Transcript_43649/m.170830 type:complete len:163 (-) Transcript_43649:4516-5004(-)